MEQQLKKKLEINREEILIDAKLLEFFKKLSEIVKNNYNKDFRVFEGHRTLERQKQLFNQGYSKTLKSNHLYNPSKAIDIIEYPWTWSGFILSNDYKNLVNELLKKFPNVSWGGNWTKFIDLPHFELKNEKK